MSLTSEDSRWIKQYDQMPQNERNAVDSAERAVMHEIRHAGLNAAGDDRAAGLLAAITRYVIESYRD